MKNIGIRLTTDEKEILYTVLSVDRDFLNKLKWKLMFLEGTYNDREVLPLETQVNSSEYGVALSYQQVKELSNRVNDLWNLLLVGQFEKNNVVRKGDEDAEIFDSSDVVIEYFDSSYWTITSSNIVFIESVKREIRQAFEVYQ
jgi:hypothetical protein